MFKRNVINIFKMPQNDGKDEWLQKMDQKQYIQLGKQRQPKLEHQTDHLGAQFKCLYILIDCKYYKLQTMSQQDKEKRIRSNQNSESDNQNSESQNGIKQDQDQFDSFIADDQEVSQEYYHPRYEADSEDGSQKPKSSKKLKKHRKKLRKHRINQGQSSLDEDDLDIIQQEEQQKGRLNRLKKKTQKKAKKYSDRGDQDEQMDQFQVQDQDVGSQGSSDRGGYQEAQQQDSSFQQAFGEEGGDIFQPQDEKRNYQEQEDKQIISLDIPERYFYQLRNYAKMNNTSIEEAMKIFQTQDRNNEVKWIYSKLKFNGDEREVKENIRNVLEALHKEKIEIMFIYYYRRKIYGHTLNRNDLWRIYKLDQQWFIFKQQFKKLRQTLVDVIFSLQELPRLENMLQQTVDLEKLKYFREFQAFKLSKPPINGKRSYKHQVISQVRARGVEEWLNKSEAFLSPENLCHNLNNRTHDKKCKTPHAEPRDQLEKLLKSSNPQNDKINYPLLVPEKRIPTICHYLELELFSHPELRQILKEKYMKKLVICTTPTSKGSQDINLYSMYFPVKKIRQKPIQTLNRQVWILAVQAEKQDLINIQLKFEWEASGLQTRNFDGDQVYKYLSKYYYDISVHKEGEVWNLFRKQVLTRMLQDYFFPAFFKQVKEELTKQGQEVIIEKCCQSLRDKLLIQPHKAKKALAMVMEDKKLGIAFVDEYGQAHSPLQITLSNDQDLRKFAKDDILQKYVQDFKPQIFYLSANCRRAQTLRKAIRQSTDLPFCSFGAYEVPSLVARQRRLEGSTEQISVLQAISMARYQKNPLAQILTLWNSNIKQNGVLSINLHPYQTFINQNKLKDSLELIAIEVVNLVGVDINEITHRDNDSGRKILQFVSGFGPRKAYDFYDKIKQENIYNRKQLQNLVSGDIVFKNCSPFFKIETQFHKGLLEKLDKDKKKEKYHQINLLDMTRIPVQWYEITESLCLKMIRNSQVDMRQRKIYTNYPEETLALIEIFKHPQKVNNIEWIWKRQENIFFDGDLVKSQLESKFKMMEVRNNNVSQEDLFFSLLKESRQTLKKYMIFTVKIISVIKQKFLNVVIPQNGLFGSIKIYQDKPEYQKGNYIKAVITNFPFDPESQRRSRNNQSGQERQLLKVEMALNFPHKSQDKGPDHNCFATCFHEIVKEIHPIIDLDRDRFDLAKEDRPIVQVRQQHPRQMKTEFRKIGHKKFKNLSAGPAIQFIKSEPIGQFVFRPSSDGLQYLNATWHFFKGIIAHIKLRSEQKNISTSSNVYRIVSDKDNKVYNSLDEVIEKYINPMNSLVQDVVSNRKFKTDPIDKIQEAVKLEMNREPNLIHYYFGCSPEYPQYFLLVYMYRDKKPVKELIKVRNTGLFFHQQIFSNIRDLISWFKQHLKDKEYQKFVKSYAIRK